MRLGVDLDNTLACYDGVFQHAAVAAGLLPEDGPRDKHRIREALRAAGREGDWTALQGSVYGPFMGRAVAFPGALDALRRLRSLDVDVRVISHRTPVPFAGPAHDLHASARAWLARAGVHDDPPILAPEHVLLETTLASKLARIAMERCDVFVDDLPEVLAHEAFPANVRRVLFDPASVHRAEANPGVERVATWQELADLLTASAPR